MSVRESEERGYVVSLCMVLLLFFVKRQSESYREYLNMSVTVMSFFIKKEGIKRDLNRKHVKVSV